MKRVIFVIAILLMGFTNEKPEALCVSSNFAVYQSEGGMYSYRIGSTWHHSSTWSLEVDLTYNACLQANQ